MWLIVYDQQSKYSGLIRFSLQARCYASNLGRFNICIFFKHLNVFIESKHTHTQTCIPRNLRPAFWNTGS